MKAAFQETKLPDHPVVRRAFDVLARQNTCPMRQAIETAELLAVFADTPDPDAIAVLLYEIGIGWREKIENFSDEVSPRAAQYIEERQKFSVSDVPDRDECHCQIALAVICKVAREYEEQIASGKYYDHGLLKASLHIQIRSLLPMANTCNEKRLVQKTFECWQSAYSLLMQKFEEAQETFSFANSGLPQDIFLQGIYEQYKTKTISSDVKGFRLRRAIDAARILQETNVSTDSCLLAAAFVLSISPADSVPLMEKLGEEEKRLARIACKIEELEYRNTCPPLGAGESVRVAYDIADLRPFIGIDQKPLLAERIDAAMAETESRFSQVRLPVRGDKKKLQGSSP